ncbi:KAT8 regulatory NSL complex subunit 2-like [Halichondria panicea]|uniref:KAT8 regulatory NSL complex subunit 2-like n=1 Tax=Halichondria panicea TaxID=6063 RepID=UPI00312B513A
MASKSSSHRSGRKRSKLTAGGVWKGENETDPELMEEKDQHPLTDAGAWTEDEAYKIYREKLVRLRDLYVGQLGHLKHVLHGKRREFLQRWQYEGGASMQASLPSQGGSLEDSAYRCYRKRSGEEALLERKQKQRRIGSSLDYFCKRDVRDMHKAHYQYLVKLHQESPSVNATHCTSGGCDHPCIPYSTRCSRHIFDDEKQLFYTKCSYVFPSGGQCSNPVPLYMVPPLCGGHCDNVSLNSPETGQQQNSHSQAINEVAVKTENTDLDIQR